MHRQQDQPEEGFHDRSKGLFQEEKTKKNGWNEEYGEFPFPGVEGKEQQGRGQQQRKKSIAEVQQPRKQRAQSPQKAP